MPVLFRYSRFEPEERRQPTVAADFAKWSLARLRTLEPVVKKHAYLCSGRFTAADVSVGYALLLAQDFALESRFTPAIAEYWQRLQLRPAFIRALKAHEVAAPAQGVSIVPAPDTAPGT
ncbi:MAG: glutathione S-transferase family protein [Cupriavidus necator]